MTKYVVERTVVFFIDDIEDQRDVKQEHRMRVPTLGCSFF